MTILSGIQPSGTLHLGNYLGAIRQFVSYQREDAYYAIVDLHALTLGIDPVVLRTQTRELAGTLLASGLDPNVCVIFQQSHIEYHAQLSWILECVATYGELSRMTAFKEKASRQDGFRVGLFTYPVLMAADILLYGADRVPVGEDQRQHLELTREIAERFNNRYGTTFVVPQGVQPPAGARVMDLQEPSRKMSKSVDSPLGTIYLTDSASDIEKKIMKSVTDTESEVRYDPSAKPGVSNLLEIFAAFTNEQPAKIASRYERYGDLKKDLATAVIDGLQPLQSRFTELMQSPAEIDRLISIGDEKARETARATYERAAHAVGLS